MKQQPNFPTLLQHVLIFDKWFCSVWSQPERF